MHATRYLVGCTLCLVSMSVAATTSVESQGMGSSSHAVLSSSQHDNIGTTGEVTGGSGGNEQASPNTDPSSPSSSSNDPDNPATVPMHHAQAHHVGWQSLLPGSIQ